MESIGARLKNIRKKRGLTLRALGKAANVSHSFIADIESGRSNPSLDTLEALAKALDVPIIDIIGDTNYENKQESVDLAEAILKMDVMFDGEPLSLTAEERQSVLEFIKTAINLINQKETKK
jgi:transcriptional regulator with XRE-family HTH domain